MSTDTAIIDGYEHYLNSDGIRTLIGPVRHRASKRVAKARALIAAKLNRTKENPVQPFANNDDAGTNILPSVRHGDPDETTQFLPPAQQIGRMLEGLKLPTFHVNPPKPEGYKGKARKSRVAEVGEAVMDRLYDSSWHEMVRSTAITVGHVALVTLSIVVFTKAFVWVVLL